MYAWVLYLYHGLCPRELKYHNKFKIITDIKGGGVAGGTVGSPAYKPFTSL